MFFAQVLFLTRVWGYGIVKTGLAMMPGPVVVMVLAPYFGRLAGRVGQRTLLVPGGLIYAASGVWLHHPCRRRRRTGRARCCPAPCSPASASRW